MRLRSKIHDAKILLVDDDPISLKILAATLKKDGYKKIFFTQDPYQAFHLYRHHRFEVIVCDMHMPGMNGFEVMTTLMNTFCDEYLPIIVLTADDSDDVRNLVLASGAKDFVTKPFNRTEILLRIKNLVETTYLHRELAAQNEILEAKVNERTKKLYDAQVKLIESLGRAAEYRDNETGTHVTRISETTAILGKEYGLNKEDTQLLAHASPMHDVGKIGIPDNVLLKPGKLKAKEWAIMKTHAELGAIILHDREHESELLKLAAEIALTHHERWDGSGYPRQLRAEDIPLFTRITSICDVFDALTSRRPYKQAWTQEEALTYIQKEKNKFFDPKIVECFLDVIDKICEVREKYPDPEDDGDYRCYSGSSN